MIGFSEPVSLVMIAYNEEGHIEEVLREYSGDVMSRCPEGSEHILYLDGPKDRTPEIAEAVSKDLPIKVIHCRQNRGYSGAVRAALSEAKNGIILFSDASGKHRASDFWEMAPHIADHDIVNGKRSGRTDPLHRKLLSAAHRAFVAVLFLVRPMDYNTGFKIYRKRAIEDILPKCKTLPLTISTEMMLRSYKAGLRICEVPVAFMEKKEGSNNFPVMKLPSKVMAQLLPYLRLRSQLPFP